MRNRLRRISVAIAITVLAEPSLWACAACFGKSDSQMAKGMNMGIFFLLGVIVTVLGGIAGAAIFLAKRAASLPREIQPVEILETTTRV